MFERLTHRFIASQNQPFRPDRSPIFDRSAIETEIKSSYRRLALALHPDQNGGDQIKTARFRAATDAYVTLTDPRLRTVYDRENNIIKPVKSSFSAPAGSAPPGMKYRPTAPPKHPIMDYEEWYRMQYGGGFREKVSREEKYRPPFSVLMARSWRGGKL